MTITNAHPFYKISKAVDAYVEMSKPGYCVDAAAYQKCKVDNHGNPESQELHITLINYEQNLRYKLYRVNNKIIVIDCNIDNSILSRHPLTLGGARDFAIKYFHLNCMIRDVVDIFKILKEHDACGFLAIEAVRVH